MNKTKILGVSKDNKYVFTNRGFYVTENKGIYVPYNHKMIPYLVKIAKDNNEFEYQTGQISLNEYISKPKKVLNIISEAFYIKDSINLITEWNKNFNKKFILNESRSINEIRKKVKDSFDGLKFLVSEQIVDANASDIVNKLIAALSKTFNDDETEALKQIKRINSKDLLDKVNNILKTKKNMDIKTYINSEMSDVDFEYKAIYDHLKTIDASLSKGYQSNKFLQATGKVIDTTAKVGGLFLKGLSAAAKAIILPILKKGVIPLLRWIRRNAYTSIGIVVDVVTALIPITTGVNKTIWGLLVMLDLYELITGESDSQDEERNANPYMYLIIDLISFLFSSAAGQTAKIGLKTATAGTKVSSGLAKMLKSLIQKVPMLKNGLKTIMDFLIKKLPSAYKVLQVVFRGIDKIIMGVETFIRQLLSKKGALALGTGIGIAWLFNQRPLEVGDSGNDVAAVNQYFYENHNLVWPECTIDENLINLLKNDGNKFTKNTEQAVKTFEACLSKDQNLSSIVKSVDGKITDKELAFYTSAEMDDRNIVTKYIPHSVKEKTKETIGNVMKLLSQGAEKILKPITNK
jgi:hypothetical protein